MLNLIFWYKYYAEINYYNCCFYVPTFEITILSFFTLVVFNTYCYFTYHEKCHFLTITDLSESLLIVNQVFEAIARTLSNLYSNE